MSTPETIRQQVLSTIQRLRLFGKKARILVSVSGGPDSVALLAILSDLAPQMELAIRAAHLNHGCRGAESDQDEQFVRGLCRSLDIPLRVDRLERSQRNAIGSNWESEARRLRYDFLAATAFPAGETVATGHTLDDQAETFLMKLCRGAGPSGLSGIFPVRNHQVPGVHGRQIRVVRPLLETSREQIMAFLRDTSQAYRTDSSNADLRFDRNWVRHQLIPVLSRRLNPALSRVLARTAGLLGETEAFLVETAGESLGQLSEKEGRDLLIDIPALEENPLILRKQILREAVRRVRGSLADVTHGHIRSALLLASGESGRQLRLPGGIRILREFEWLRISPRPAGTPAFSYAMEVPGEIRISEVHKRLSIFPTQAPRGLTLPGRSVMVRNRRPGDRFRGSGLRPEKKLKQILRENRVPVSKRDQMLIVTCDNEVVWVEGLGPSVRFANGTGGEPRYAITVFNETF